MARGTTIIGLERLHRKLKRLPQVAREMIRKAMEQAADDIVGMMKRLVAVYSGDLRDSIGWTWGAPPKGSLVISVLKGAGVGGDMTLTIYAGGGGAYWARWIEFGVKDAKSALRKSGQPFFYVSWRARRKDTKRDINKAVRKAAKQVASGG